MLLASPGANNFATRQASWGTTRPAGANGTAITPGAGAEGSWAQLFAATSQDSFGILININSNNASAASRGTVVDIGIDLAGGSSYTEVIPDLLCGGAGALHQYGGLWYYFPLFIPAGASIAARGNSTVATAFRVGAVLMQQPSNPENVRRASFVRTFGISGNIGTVIVPGTTSEGAWTLIGTTADPLWHWQIGMQVATTDTAWGATVLFFDFAIGDASNKHVVIQDQPFNTSASEFLNGIPMTIACEWPVPSGTNLYMRAQNAGGNDAYTCAVYGAGG